MIGNKKITIVAFALSLSMMCQAQSRKVINLPSWDFSRDGKAWSQVARLGYLRTFRQEMGPADGGYRAEW